jgi:hypothetical protein
VLAAVAAADPAAAVSAWRGASEAGAIAGSGGAASGPERSVAAVAALGQPAGIVLAALLEVTDEPADSFASPVAGLLLAQRILIDVRLARLAAQHRYPPAGQAHLIAAVALWWAGDDGAPNGQLDPVVRLLAGPGSPRTVAELADAWRETDTEAHRKWRVVVDDLLAAHRVAPLSPGTDPVGHTAAALLRIWARWLRGFDQSSAPYLLDRFLRRPGVVRVAPDAVTVELPRRPLDTVLEVSGYFRPVEALPSDSSSRLRFLVRESA